MAGKRRRDISSTESELIEIYEDLANENEEIRLKAAQKLLTRHAELSSDSLPKIRGILERLFRGLCSSRKAARLGFSVALTELISQLFANQNSKSILQPADILDLLKKQTLRGGTASGQDERDLYFGRLFGAEAIIKSRILFSPKPNLSLWQSLLLFVCEVASKKAWIRQECGWIFYASISQLVSSNLDPDFALTLVETLQKHNLTRTPEGVAIWLEIKQGYPDAALPKKMWKHRDPLNKSEAVALGEVMKDARSTKLGDSGDEPQSHGAGTWSQQLHFAWDIVLREVLGVDGSKKKSSKRLGLAGFWKSVVDGGLFSAKSSAERKHWGMLLMAKAVALTPTEQIENTLTPQTRLILINSLKNDDRYLHRSALKVMQALEARAKQDSSAVPPIIRGLALDPSGDSGFDDLIKTKIVHKILLAGNLAAYRALLPDIQGLIERTGLEDEKAAGKKRRTCADMLALICNQALAYDAGTGMEVAKTALNSLIIVAYSKRCSAPNSGPLEPLPAPESRAYIRTRIRMCLDQSLQSEKAKSQLLRYCIEKINDLQKSSSEDDFIIDFDEETQRIFNKSWKILEFLRGGNGQDGLVTKVEPIESWELLYSLAVLQLFDGDAEAIGILDDLNFACDPRKSQDTSRVSGAHEYDSIVEILLSFASKPSRLFHKVGMKAFQASASQLSRAGIESMIRILDSKENSAHAGELFELAESADQPMEDANGSVNGHISGSNSSDSGFLGSDVEELSEVSYKSDDDAAEESDRDDAELKDFEAKLVAALGTRKGQDDNEADDSDDGDFDMKEEDMDEKEMEALDEKLAEVFRAQKANKGKKQERKDAKAAIINLKRRVLDLIEVFLKEQPSNILTLEFFLPLIRTARTTTEKQISDRAHKVLEGLFQRSSKTKAKGLPIITTANGAMNSNTENPIETIINLLKAVHQEAGRDNSKAHANICSKSSILLMKVLVKASVNVGELVDIYGESRKKQLMDKGYKVNAMFFTEWSNWCVSARDMFVGNGAGKDRVSHL